MPANRFEALKVRRETIKTRGKAGQVVETEITYPSHRDDPKLDLPEGGLHQDAPRLDTREAPWVPPHLRKPAWKK